ncbi:hypothetical protein SGRIM128S_07968 [Streptomyces griseomycini]
MDAPVEPSFAEMAISATDVFAEPLPLLPSSSPPAFALPLHAVRVKVPTTRAAQATSARRAAMSGVVTGCSRFE